MQRQIRMLVLVTALFGSALLSCSPVTGASPAPATSTGATSAAASPTATPTGSTQVLLAGTLTSVDIERDQYVTFADRGALYAVSTRDAPSPFLSKIQRFDATARVWRTVFEDDAHFLFFAKPEGGRLALIEYREPFQGRGANDQRLLVLDLATGTASTIDAYALSAATFHGGGGGPRRPGSRIVLAGDTVVWTRINELSGGETEGEMRVAKVSDPAHFSTIGRSREWIEPLWIDGTTLVYVLGGTARDDLRARDLTSGIEHSIVTLRAPGQSAGRAGIGRSGDLIGWIDNPPLSGAPDAKPTDPRTAFLHTVSVATGAARDLDLAATYCVALSGNALGFVWSCPPASQPVTTLSYFDPRTWKSVDIVRSGERPNDLQAFENAFLWYEVFNGARRAKLLTLP